MVDSSVWIEFFRESSDLDLEDIVDLDEVVTCLPVVQEVLQGFDDERAFRTAHEAMLSLPLVESPVSEEVYLQAVGLYRTGRRAGLTVRSSVDCLIAACAIRSSLAVMHRDRDFEALSRISTLETVPV